MPITRRILGIISLCILATFISQVPGAHAGTLSASLQTYVETRDPSRVKVWIYFTDHGESSTAELQHMLASVQINERALERRTRRSRSSQADAHDLPVNVRYVRAVRELGDRVRQESRYFNAVSALVTPKQLRKIAQLQFVRHIDRVRTGTRKALRVNPAALNTLRATGKSVESARHAAPFQQSTLRSSSLPCTR